MGKKKKALYTKKSISYGLVNGISSLKTNMTGTYLSFFLTTFVGLTNVQLGTMNTIKGLVGLWGSFVIGVIMQKVRLPWGRYRSWIYIMMPLAGIFQILTFVNWGNIPENVKFSLVFVICILDTFLYNFAFAAYLRWRRKREFRMAAANHPRGRRTDYLQRFRGCRYAEQAS